MLRRTEAGWTLPDAPQEAARYLASGAWRRETLGDLVAAGLDADPDRLAVIDGERRWTRRALHDAAIHLGAALARRGLEPGSVVSFQLPNWGEACVINLACALYGFVLNPLLPMYRERDLNFILSQCRSDALFLPERFRNIDFRALHANVRYETRREDRIFWVRPEIGVGQSFESLMDETASPPNLPDVDPASVKLIVYTSGSTGRPKGVLHSHDTLHAMVRFAAEFWSIGEDDLLFVPSPIAHIGGSVYAFEFPWITGACAVLMESWNPAEAVDLIESERATFCAGATPFLQGLLASALEKNTRLPSLRRFICGGASVPSSLIAEAAGQFDNCVISRAYGSSEVPIICPGVRSKADAAYGAATDGEVTADIRIVDGRGEPVPAGENGEIIARAPRMFVGYLDSSDEEGQFTPDGYFRMGDIGHLVDGRFLEITGRKKEIIIRNGENISPREVENVLLSHHAILQVAIIGAPDERTGERAVAFAVIKPNLNFDMGVMQKFLGESGVAKQKFPEELYVLDHLPMNSIGKILKEELKSMLPAVRNSASALTFRRESSP